MQPIDNASAPYRNGLHIATRRITVGALLVVSAPAMAGGFYVPQQGAIGVGLANAGGTVRASDASVVFFNPATMTRLDRGVVQLGVTVISPNVSIDNRESRASTPGNLGAATPYFGPDADNRGDPVPIPSFYAAYPLRPDLWLGFGLSTPFGLDLEYDSGWFGRYDSIKNSLATANLSPVIAYRVNDRLSIGGGIDIQYADAELTQAIPDPLTPGGPNVFTDGRSKLTGNDWTVGFNLGLSFQATERTRLGLHYRSSMDHEIDGDSELTGLSGPLAALNGKTGIKVDLNLPAILSAGIAHDLSSDLTLYGEAQWFGWSSFEDLDIRFDGPTPNTVLKQGFRDSYAVALGARYKLDDRWTLRGGVQYDQTPTVDKYRNTSIPDGDWIFIAFGASYRFKERMFLDLGANYVFVGNEDIDLQRAFFAGSPLASEINIRGRTDVRSSTLSLNYRYEIE